jgi:hypothetical protein
MEHAQHPRRVRRRLTMVHEDAAGLDVGATFHVVAVPADRDAEPVRTFQLRSLRARQIGEHRSLRPTATRGGVKITAEDACESAALTKFVTTKTAGCDPCTNLVALGAFVEGQVDSANAGIYCASPSGAFLQ